MNFMGFINKNYNKKEFIAKMCINSSKGVSTYHYLATNLAVQNTHSTDTYISMNPMKFIDKSIHRDKKHVSRLKWLFVDLDTYKSDYSNLTNEQILGNLEMDLFGRELPYPNYVIDSGRGMYVLWRIDEHIAAEPRWIYVQKYLNQKLSDYGSDKAVVTDTARVLRAVGSINSKSNTVVKIMENYTDHIYTLYEIMQEYIPNNWGKNTNKKYNNNNKIIFLNNSYSLNSARCKDLKTLLINYRDYKGGYREYILFLYRYYTLCSLDNKELALKETIILNSQLKNPLSKKEVISATKSAEKYYDNNGFKISNRKIIEIINITEDEMKSLSTIISASEKVLRKCERNRKAYLTNLMLKGKETKEKSIKKRLLSELALLKQGKSQKEICKILNISKSTFYTDKKKLVNLNLEEQKEEQGKTKGKVNPKSLEVNNLIDMKIKPILENKNIKNSPKNSALVLRGRSP